MQEKRRKERKKKAIHQGPNMLQGELKSAERQSAVKRKAKIDPEETEYAVEYIKDIRHRQGRKRECLVKWLGYDEAIYNTWEPEKNLEDNEYHKQFAKLVRPFVVTQAGISWPTAKTQGEIIKSSIDAVQRIEEQMADDQAVDAPTPLPITSLPEHDEFQQMYLCGKSTKPLSSKKRKQLTTTGPNGHPSNSPCTFDIKSWEHENIGKHKTVKDRREKLPVVASTNQAVCNAFDRISKKKPPVQDISESLSRRRDLLLTPPQLLHQSLSHQKKKTSFLPPTKIRKSIPNSREVPCSPIDLNGSPQDLLFAASSPPLTASSPLGSNVVIDIFAKRDTDVNRLEVVAKKRAKLRKTIAKTKHAPILIAKNIADEHLPDNFTFVEDYILAKNIPKPDDGFLSGCACKTACSVDNLAGCACQEDLEIANYNEAGLVNIEVGSPIHECNKKCSCSIECPNRVTQQGRKVHLQIYKTKSKGLGVRATKHIPKGTFIDLYLGELITHRTAQIRGKRCDQEAMTYLFDLDGGIAGRDSTDPLEDSLGGIDIKYSIDAQKYGNVTHFFNHSCDPNLTVYSVFKHPDHQMHDLAFFATKNIPADTELTFDYKVETVRNLLECHCKTAKCRGYVF